MSNKLRSSMYVWELGRGELPRFATEPDLTCFHYSGFKSQEVCKVDTVPYENDRPDYAELLVPIFEISFRTKKPAKEEKALKKIAQMEDERFEKLLEASKDYGTEVLFDKSVCMIKQAPLMLPIEGGPAELWYEELSIALMVRKKKGEPRNNQVWTRYPVNHDKDCFIRTPLSDGKPYNGICTCGHGSWYLQQHGDDQYMFSEERRKAM